MVSTRGYRYKFSKGERVLCYEPDPTKVKVLYNSKVVEVIESKDKRGRRSVQYLIHFQGWNSSWDRRVEEDFLLRDTVENRQLQRELAERSQLQLGAYLYRRERKRGSSMSAGSGAAKRPRHGLGDDGSLGTAPSVVGLGTSALGGPEVVRLEKVDSTDTSSIDVERVDEQPLPAPSSRSSITLPQDLKDRLTVDYHMVSTRGRLVRLRAKPCAAEILESFVQWFARAGAWQTPRTRHDQPHKPNLLDVSARLNLVREVADGLRMYFDFVLRGHLLYAREIPQYELYCGTDRFKPIKQEKIMDPALAAAIESLNSPTKLPDYSHLPPDPVSCHAPLKTDPKQLNHTVTAGDAGYLTVPVKVEPVGEPAPPACWPVKPKPAPPPSLPPPPARKPPARRLRSHKSSVSHPEDEPMPSTSHDLPSSSACSSNSSRSEGVPRPLPVATPTRTPLSLLLDKVSKWQIVPREGTDHLPCRVYGAIHLTRLFLKLPDFLLATNMPDYKLKLILKHVDMFVQYIHEHPEWFGDIQYEPSPPPRPH